MNAKLLTIGDELLIGNTINTNSSWMAQELTKIGITVTQHLTLSDDKVDIIACLDAAILDANIILITGGLGPTSDDITKQTLANYFNTELVFNEAAYQNIERIFSGRMNLINEATRQVAYLPKDCIVIPNKNGTAAGMLFQKEGKIIISMPGVPYEMKAMVSDFVIPFLQKQFTLPIILHKHIETAGAGETQIAERLQVFEQQKPNFIKLAYLPHVGSVTLRLTATGIDKMLVENAIEEATKNVIAVITDWVIGVDGIKLQEAVGNVLINNNATLSIAESCSGGYLAHLITSVAGSSAYFKGSVTAYANEVKHQLLGVSQETLTTHGAVSEATILELLQGTLKLFNTDYAIATSGIAGPSGGTTEKPVGTIFIGVANKEKQIVKRFQFTTNRERNIQLTATAALVLLLRFIKNG